MARLIAIDPGAWEIQVTALSSSGDDAEVEGTWRQRVPHEPGERPSVADRLAALDLLLHHHPDLASTAHLAVVGWPMDRTTLRTLDLPFDNDDQIAQTLPFALEAEVPFDLDAMHLSWRKLGSGEVQATLVPRDELRQLLEGLASRGLDPKIAITAADALSAQATAQGEVVAIVDVGDSHATVVVARDRRTLSARALGTGVRDAAAAVANALSCTPREARILLGDDPSADPELPTRPDAPPAFVVDEDLEEAGEDPAFSFDGPGEDDDETVEATVVDVPTLTGRQDPVDAPPPPPMRSVEDRIRFPVDDEPTDPSLDLEGFARGGMPNAARHAVDPVLDTLVREIRASLVAAEDALGVGVDAVVLSGGGSHLEGLRDRLVDTLDLPVRGPTDPSGDPAADEAVVRGLAWRLHDGGTDVTDLRSGDLAFRGGLDLPRAILGYGGIGLGLFVLTMLLGFGYQYATLSGRVADYDARTLAVIGEAIDVPDGMDARVALDLLGEVVYDNGEQVAFLGDATDAPPTVDLLYRLTKAFPPHPEVTVTVDSLDVTPEQIRIEGSTEGYAQVDRIGASLEASGRFGAVQAEGGNRSRDGRLGFSVVASRDPDAVAPTDEDGEG